MDISFENFYAPNSKLCTNSFSNIKIVKSKIIITLEIGYIKISSRYNFRSSIYYTWIPFL